ncbi:tail protein X [Anaerobacillus sp. HL2]|nr:tail protein X [Anaerobacillus sp. HL2]
MQGDLWDVIAKKTLGSEYQMIALIEANPKHRETVIFPANVVLTIPEIEPSRFVQPPPCSKMRLSFNG